MTYYRFPLTFCRHLGLVVSLAAFGMLAVDSRAQSESTSANPGEIPKSTPRARYGGVVGPGPQMSPELMRRYGLMPPEGFNGLTGGSDPECTFDIDVPACTPHALIAHIRESMPKGAVLNVIIPEEFAPVTFPPLRLQGVTLSSLFEAITAVTERSTVSAGFRRMGGAGEPVWVFFSDPVDQPPARTRVCRFFQLRPYLETYTIEDITTAIRTGYDLVKGEVPEMKFHPETSLLIAVGYGESLALIDEALSHLPPAPREVDPKTGAPLPIRKVVPRPATEAK